MESQSGAYTEAPSPTLRLGLGLFLLSAALLLFEINLTRLFSVTQFYHFAFMVVSIALLGYGASGTLLAIFPRLSQGSPQSTIGWLSLLSAISILLSYLLINRLPFDSFSIAWDRKQVWILFLHYAMLALPFLFGGMAVSLLLALYPRHSGRIYSVNLLGSALGCILALLAPSSILGGEGTVILSSGMAALAALTVAFEPLSSLTSPGLKNSRRILLPALVCLLLLFVLADLSRRASGRPVLRWFELHISPYKSLSYALQVPGAELIFQRWNAFSRIDVVRSPGIHSYPGLSYRYLQPLPAENGITVDGDELSPVLLDTTDLQFSEYLPAALAFQLRPRAETLVLEPRGGLDILAALAQGAVRVTAVEINPLIVSAARDIYRDPRIKLEIESSRSYLRHSAEQFDVIVISLSSSYHPVRSGAYSLGEDYLYTIESFQDALSHLKPNGITVVARWLQNPPSESLRAFALAVTALERSGGDPRSQIIALRSYNTGFLLFKKSSFTPDELNSIREFAASRAFDLIYAPGIHANEVNQYNILAEPIYYEAYTSLLETEPRAEFYEAYPFDVTPPSDDQPFFGHYFKWSQAEQVLAELGKTWQPFGGAGYFVVFALLLLAVLMAGILIVLPAAIFHWVDRAARWPSAAVKQPGGRYLVYFGLIGLAFIMVEIPLIQRFILYLGHPAYAMTTVLFTLLFFSGLGSRFARISVQAATGTLVILLLAAAWLLSLLFNLTLGLPLAFRFLIAVFAIAPAGFLMGVPFPAGIRWMLAGGESPSRISWVWAVNGTASVLSSVLAALLALSFGFDWVFRLGAICYAAAWLVIRAGSKKGLVSSLRR